MKRFICLLLVLSTVVSFGCVAKKPSSGTTMVTSNYYDSSIQSDTISSNILPSSTQSSSKSIISSKSSIMSSSSDSEHYPNVTANKKIQTNSELNNSEIMKKLRESYTKEENDLHEKKLNEINTNNQKRIQEEQDKLNKLLSAPSNKFVDIQIEKYKKSIESFKKGMAIGTKDENTRHENKLIEINRIYQ